MLGIDKGTTYTKTDQKICIKSTIREYQESDISLQNDKLILEMENKKWVIGEKGNYSTDLMKSQHYNTKALVLTAIAQSTTDECIITDIVTGLPIALYSGQKQIMKNLFQDTNNEIRINGIRKRIRIRNAEVFPEAAGAFYSQNEFTDALIIDVGGLSIDTAQFKGGKLIKYSTYSMGMMKLFSKIANKVNSEHDLSLTEWDIEDLLKDGLFIYGKQVDIGAERIIIEHAKEIIERLSLEYDLKSLKNILITGGPADWISKYLAKYIPQLRTMKNNQYSNAIGYSNIGRVIFG
jgi:plasmid segregation protein ParM